MNGEKRFSVFFLRFLRANNDMIEHMKQETEVQNGTTHLCHRP